MLSKAGAKAARRISAADAAAFVKSGDWLDYGVGFNQPDAFDHALAARAAELRDVTIRNCLSMRPRAFLEADPRGEHFRCFNWHFSGYDRRLHDAGRCQYIPCNLGEIPTYYRRFVERLDIAVIKTAPMDAEGYFNYGPLNLWHPAVVERAATVIIEECADIPPVHGPQVKLHRSQVDYVIPGDGAPIPELPNAATTDVDRAVAAKLGEQVGVDPVKFGMEVFLTRPSGSFTAAEMVGNDIKMFEPAGKKLLIGQYETVDKTRALGMIDEIREAMRAYAAEKGADGIVLCITDIMEEGSQVLLEGETEAAQKGLGIADEHDGVWMPGVLSRKKQVAAPIMAAC